MYDSDVNICPGRTGPSDGVKKVKKVGKHIGVGISKRINLVAQLHIVNSYISLVPSALPASGAKFCGKIRCLWQDRFRLKPQKQTGESVMVADSLQPQCKLVS